MSEFAKKENLNDYNSRGEIKTINSLTQSTSMLSPATIKVFVAYTPAVAQNHNIATVIPNCINTTLGAYNSSQVSTRIELAGSSQLSYTESGNDLTDVNRFKNNNDGYMDEIHSLRQQYEADICVLLVNTLNSNGRVPDGAVPASYDNAFCVVLASSAVGYYSFAHELNHLFGCRHEKKFDGSGSYINGTYYEDCHGKAGIWNLYNNERKYKTIMAVTLEDIPGWQRVPYFSNPNIYDNSGRPLGEIGVSYCAKIIDVAAPMIAQFEPKYRAIIDGPLVLQRTQTGIYTCLVKAGTSPYNYFWERMAIGIMRAAPGDEWVPVGTNSPTYIKGVPTNGDFRDFKLRCTVTDAANKRVVSNELYIQYESIDPKTISTDGAESLSVEEESFLDNYPNPFNPSTKIYYSLSKSENVIIKVYDILGKEIIVLVNDIQSAGKHVIEFNGANLPSGTYIVMMQTGDKVQSKKIMLVK